MEIHVKRNHADFQLKLCTLRVLYYERNSEVELGLVV